MRDWLLVLAGCAALAGCGQQQVSAGDELALTVACPATELELGRAVAVTVTKTWGKALVPEPLDLSPWRPLVLTEVETSRREDGARVEERTRYRCQAFTRDLRPLPPLELRARPRDGSSPRVARADAPAFTVRPAPESRPSSTPELPGGPMEPPRAWQRQALWAALTALGVGLLAWQGWRHGLFARRVTHAVLPDARTRAHERLRGLRATEPRDARELRAQCDALAEIVRDYLAAACGVGAPHLTSEELLAASEAAGRPAAEPRAALARVLGACDRVKFAHEGPTEPMLSRLRDDAERVVSS